MRRIPYIVAIAALGTILPGIATAQTEQNTAAAATTAASPAAAAPKLGADGKIILAEGTEVLDTQGGKVGTLTKVEKGADGQPTNVILKTEKSEVLIPASSLARTEKNALIAMTAAQIDQAAAAANPAAAADSQTTAEASSAGAAATNSAN